MKPYQKFIAGAVCPKCKELDSLLLSALDQSIECVDCGFIQTEIEREQENIKQQAEQNVVKKAIPKNINVSNIIRITNLEK